MLPQFTDHLDSARLDVFKKLSAFDDRFILAGGTALMLQIGHRLSYDFDCFSLKPLPKPLVHKSRRIFGSSILVEVDEEWMLTIRTKSGVEISFVHHPFPLLQKPIKNDYISLFHLDDLASNKAYVLGRRPAWRDYVDLFLLLKGKLYELEDIINLAQKKFRGEFNPKLFLGQLTYFDDVKVVKTVFLKESYTPEEIKKYLGQQVRSYLKKVLTI